MRLQCLCAMCVPLQVEGPYPAGPLCQQLAGVDLLSAPAIVLVAGGIGITPLLGIIQQQYVARRHHEATHASAVQATAAAIVNGSIGALDAGDEENALLPIHTLHGKAQLQGRLSSTFAAGCEDARQLLGSYRHGAGGGHTQPGLPRVHLFWTSRSAEEFALLDARLLEEAGRPDR